MLFKTFLTFFSFTRYGDKPGAKILAKVALTLSLWLQRHEEGGKLLKSTQMLSVITSYLYDRLEPCTI